MPTNNPQNSREIRINYIHQLEFRFLSKKNYVESNRATPASVHLAGFSLLFKLKVQTNVGPRCLVLYKGHSYTTLVSCLSC